MEIAGALCFGLVIGWVTYRTLRRKADAVAIGDIAAVIGAVGGGTVVALYKGGQLFAAYAIGLAVGFFAYLVVGSILDARDQKTAGGKGKKLGSWMGE